MFAFVVVLGVTTPAIAASSAGSERAHCRAWSVVPTPPEDGDLKDVSVVAPDDVWAVGRNGGLPPIILHWDGQSWSSVPHPASVGSLNDVVAISASDAWAVGSSFRLLAMHWDGRRWSLTHLPNPGFNAYVYGVDAVASNDVWAVGDYTGTGGIHPLAEHWDGQSWTTVRAPDGSPYGTNVFYAVSAVSSDDVWAVGYQDVTGGADFQPLVEHWDGTSWAVVGAEEPPGTDNILYSISALSATDAWAVGDFGDPDPLQPLIQHWDGATWSVVDGAPTVGVGDALYGVAAISESDVWAVGDSVRQEPFGYRPLSEHWDGVAWREMRTAYPPGTNATFLGVNAISSQDLWAVGAYTGETGRLLADHSNGPCPPVKAG